MKTPSPIETGFIKKTEKVINFGGLGVKVGQPDWSVTDNGRGLLESNVKFFLNTLSSQINGLTITPSYLSGDVPKLGDIHPYSVGTNLKCYGSTVNYSRNGIAYVEAKYIGIRDARPYTDPEVVITATTSEQPIQFHRNFGGFCSAVQFGYPNNNGQPWLKQNLVETDGDGVFKQFGPEHPYVPYVSSFLAPSSVVKINFYTTDFSQFKEIALGGHLGKIKPVTPRPLHPQGISFTLDSSLDYLQTACSVSTYADVFKVELEFTQSQKNYTQSKNSSKWNEYLYGNQTLSGSASSGGASGGVGGVSGSTGGW